MNHQRFILLLFTLTVLFSASCVGTWTVVCLPGSGCIAQVRVDYPSVSASPPPVATITLAPTLTPTLTPSATLQPTEVATVDVSPTLENAPSPTITPTWSFTDADNYYVYVTSTIPLNLRDGANTSSRVIRSLNRGTRLEVQAGVSAGLPSPWLYVITDDGDVGFVSGVWVDVRPPTQ